MNEKQGPEKDLYPGGPHRVLLFHYYSYTTLVTTEEVSYKSCIVFILVKCFFLIILFAEV